MSSFLKNDMNGKNVTERSSLESRYKNSVSNLLAVMAFSLINIILLVIQSDTYFLFSAFIPYALAYYGMYFCGMYPEEYYSDVPDAEFFDKSFLVITLVAAAVVILLYFISWFFAKKKKVGWLIFALVLFCIDTVAMFVFTGFNMDAIIDIIFHGWVIFSLVNGIVTYNKLKKLPDDAAQFEMEEDELNSQAQIQGNSAVLRMADTDVKARILLQAEVPGYNIVYRRVKRTNELVVNGRVYDEYEALVEIPHTLTCFICGHRIEALYNSNNMMYIVFDGEELAKKVRLI